MSEPEEITTMSGQKLPLKMSVDYISFSAHTDYQQTSEFIRALKPPHVVSIHATCFSRVDSCTKKWNGTYVMHCAYLHVFFLHTVWRCAFEWYREFRDKHWTVCRIIELMFLALCSWNTQEAVFLDNLFTNHAWLDKSLMLKGKLSFL